MGSTNSKQNQPQFEEILQQLKEVLKRFGFTHSDNIQSDVKDFMKVLKEITDKKGFLMWFQAEKCEWDFISYVLMHTICESLVVEVIQFFKDQFTPDKLAMIAVGYENDSWGETVKNIFLGFTTDEVIKKYEGLRQENPEEFFESLKNMTPKE